VQELRRAPHLPLHLVLRRLLHPQTEGHVLEHGHVREDRVVLEHHGEAAPARRKAAHVVAADHDAAGILPLEACDDAQKRGLAAARRPQQGDELAVADVQRDLLKGPEGAELLDDPVDDDVGHETLRYLLAMPHTANRYFLTAKMKSTEGRIRMKPPAKR
jgi:hypothetical protein